MTKRNILVFPCGSEIGLDIHQCLKFSTFFNLIGGSSVDDHGRFVFKDYVGDIPFVNAPDFAEKMKAIVVEKAIDAIYPSTDMALAVLKKIEGELGCKVIASSSETTDICLSKAKTYSVLKDAVRIPKIYSEDDEMEFPVFVKPNVGHSSIGAEKITTRDALNEKLNSGDDYLILECLTGEEYTVDCFTDRHGVLRYAAARKRNRVKAGISVNTSFVDNQDEFSQMAKEINSRIELRGAWFYQVKRDKNGQLCLLEVASRFGGSALLSCALGVNLPLLSIFDAFDYDVDVTPNAYNVELDRAFSNRYKTDIEYDTVYVDYDDCLILEKKYVNAGLVQFLYQCVNKGKRVVLLSKHDGDLESELVQFRVKDIFDEVIHLPRESQKKDYIGEGKAIFIDDSFAERKDIHDATGMPVFAPEMIDVLMD
ncbi:MAG: ATP-grasp domain-containing protein [Prevotellaceae bacterium]|nr:ATP-grasp domain-containing protein [Prevotellaceae bacterium]